MESPIKHIQFTRNSEPFKSLEALISHTNNPSFLESLDPVPKDGQIILLRYLNPDGKTNTVIGKVFYQGSNPELHLEISRDELNKVSELAAGYADFEILKVKRAVDATDATINKLNLDLKSTTDTLNKKIEELSNLLKKHITESAVETSTPTEIVFTVAPPELGLPHMREDIDVDMA